ncbi:hypothetical protein Gohar_022045 [Gossypium harknessii]|uniref:Uncharacterized protein n=1 Tax=Gossypium harknessii TaxID=34285 RepID=A0A7J9IER4_9ROSI|nr:hypothetical protein [Gossypium harknessii]
MNWDFPIGPGHFGASGSFMMNRMIFKRMIRRSCKWNHTVPALCLCVCTLKILCR